MTPEVQIALLLIGSYLFGSIPFGVLIARQMGIDIRSVGSGNIGATNVSRACGPKAGAVVLTLDALKGLVPPLIGLGLKLHSQWQVLAALLAIIGHNYSVFLGFKGGKGIATSAGALFGIAWKVGLSGAGVFALVFAFSRFVSLGSIVAALSLPPLMWLFYPGDYYRLAFSIAACLMAVYKHRANIQRLLAGTEPKFGRKDA